MEKEWESFTRQQEKTKKKGIIFIGISAILLIAILGVSFAFWNYAMVGENQLLVAGNIYMKFIEGNELNIENALPIDINNYYVEKDEFTTNVSEGDIAMCASLFRNMLKGFEDIEGFCKGTTAYQGMYIKELLDSQGLTDQFKAMLSDYFITNSYFNASPEGYAPLKYLEYTIEGKNTYDKDITYEVLLQYGKEHGTRTERLKDKLLKFRLVEVVDGEEKEIFTNRSYDELNNTKIYIDTIPAKTNKKITKTYRLYMWISNETVIGVGDNIDYEMDTWNNLVFASVKLQVNGDFEDKKITYDKEVATTKIKNTLGKGNGVIGLNSKSEKVTSSSSDIREYRYSGPVVNNYVYYNCENENNQTKDTCEIWRIIGVFDDNKGEHLKIVKNSVLENGKLPKTYIVDGREYNITYQEGISSPYWNSPTDENYNNDWTTAGLQYYLNSESDDDEVNKGYLSYLKDYSKNMIDETTYYLGNATHGTVQTGGSSHISIIDTPKQVYANERSSLNCSDEKNCGGGHIWPDNQATWTGKVSLLYPSDYGFSASSIYWDTKLEEGSFNGNPANSSWLFTTASPVGEWLLSPTSFSTYDASLLNFNGAVNNYYVYNAINGFRPTFNLKSNVMIGPGSGAKMDPYWLMSE